MKVKAVVLETALTEQTAYLRRYCKLDQHCSEGEMCCRSICCQQSQVVYDAIVKALASALLVRFVAAGDDSNCDGWP